MNAPTSVPHAELIIGKDQVIELRLDDQVVARGELPDAIACEIAALKESLGEILARAWKYDDKPHQLYSGLRAAALRHADPRFRDEIVRLMDEAFENAGTVAKLRDRHRDLLEAVREYLLGGDKRVLENALHNVAPEFGVATARIQEQAQINRAVASRLMSALQAIDTEHHDVLARSAPAVLDIVRKALTETTDTAALAVARERLAVLLVREALTVAAARGYGDKEAQRRLDAARATLDAAFTDRPVRVFSVTGDNHDYDAMAAWNVGLFATRAAAEAAAERDQALYLSDDQSEDEPNHQISELILGKFYGCHYDRREDPDADAHDSNAIATDGGGDLAIWFDCPPHGAIMRDELPLAFLPKGARIDLHEARALAEAHDRMRKPLSEAETAEILAGLRKGG